MCMTLLPVRKSQQGFTLIMVLVVLVLITFVGLMAMRMATLSLMVSTNSQATVLAFQSADAAISNVEKTVNANIATALSDTGILFKSLSRKLDVSGSVIDSEAVYCFTPGLSTSLTLKGANICDPTNSTDITSNFISPRKVSLAQVAILSMPMTEAGSSDSTSTRVIVNATGVLKGVGAASETDIKTCLAKPANEDPRRGSVNQVTITDCLTTTGAIFSTQIEEYRLALIEQ